MLSEKNRKKINPNGLYRRKIDLTKVKYDDAYWCTNWTFVPQVSESEVVMIDSYYQSYQNSIYYLLDDENINDFELIFDFKDVKQVRPDVYETYAGSDRFCEACDSGGLSYPVYFIKKNAMPDKTRQLDYLDQRIDSLERSLKNLKAERESIV